MCQPDIGLASLRMALLMDALRAASQQHTSLVQALVMLARAPTQLCCSHPCGLFLLSFTTIFLLLQAAPLADALLFHRVKARLGGRVRLILSGAAPLAKPVQEMLSCCMCAPVLQGYGLTETCASSTIAEPYQWDTIGTVGGPMPGRRGSPLNGGSIACVACLA